MSSEMYLDITGTFRNINSPVKFTTASDREEQELDMALRERQLAQYGTCPQCGAPIEKDFVVCPVCDTQVRNVCPSCHRPLDAHWKVCPYCRTRIQ